MNLQQIAALTYKIYERLLENITNSEDIEILSNSRWRTAIGAALYKYFAKRIDYKYDDKYFQFSLQRNLRGNYGKFSANNNEIELNNSTVNGDQISIVYTINKRSNNVQLKLEHFPKELWSINDITILKNQSEINFLFKLISQNITSPIIANEIVQSQRNDARFEYFHEIYSKICHEYHTHNDLNAKKYYEVVLAAGVFYLPQNASNCWSHYISHEAIKTKLKNIGKQLVRDHIYSRKRAANFLLNQPAPIELNQFVNSYNNVFSKFAYVTSQENQKLINWHLILNNQGILDENIFLEDYTKSAIKQGILFHHFPNINHNEINKLIKFIKIKKIDIKNKSSKYIENEYLKNKSK
jgi:hypothetical protein